MPALLTAAGLLAIAFFVHVVVWRIRVPLRQTRALVAIFGGVFGAAAALASAGWARPLVERVAADAPGAMLFYASAACCYLIVYAGIEGVSPSLTIVRALEAASERGCTRAELAALVTDEKFILPRFVMLAQDGLVVREGHGGRLTPRGRRAAVAAMRLAVLFRIDEGA